MADFDIKPASGTGNSLRLKNEAGNIVLSTNNGTGASSWGAVAPAGTVVQMKQDDYNTQTTLSVDTTGVALDSTNFKVGITPIKTGNNIIIHLHYTMGRNASYAVGPFCKRTGPSTVAELGVVGTGSTHNAASWDYSVLADNAAHQGGIHDVSAWAKDTAQDTSTEHVYPPMKKSNGSVSMYTNKRQSDTLWGGVCTITVWEVQV